MFNIAHRGYSSLHKDNSIDAIKSAIEHKFNMIEIDIQINAENEIIIYHDIYCIEANKMIKDMKTHETELYGIVSLRHILNHVWKPGIFLYLDLKGGMQLCNCLIELFAINSHIIPFICIGTFNINHLHILFKANMDFYIGFSTSNELPLHYYQDILPIIDFVSISIDILSDTAYTFFHNNKKKIFVFTITSTIEEQYIHSNFPNVNGIISNIKL